MKGVLADGVVMTSFTDDGLENSVLMSSVKSVRRVTTRIAIRIPIREGTTPC